MRRFSYEVSESDVQLTLCDYIRLRYANALFRSDFASGLKLTMGQATKHKRLQSSRAWVDLMIYEPRHGKAGLALELKRPGVKTHKKDGSLVSDQHIQEQAAMLDRLRERGFEAHFAIGFDEARRLVDTYLEDETTDLFEAF